MIANYANCTDTLIKTVLVSAPPQIAFTATDTIKCSTGLTTQFINNTDAVAFAWDFGDTTFSAEKNPTHTYNHLGQYTVTLQATSAAGCLATLSKPAFITLQAPAIRFNDLPARGCVPLQFTPGVTINSFDSAVAYQWDFGDGQTGSGPLPVHTYTTPGIYTLRLAITTASGCVISDSAVGAVRAGTRPVAAFAASMVNTCASDAVTFTNLTAPADEFIWLFGDGTTSSERSPMHFYADTGYQDVQLIAYNQGCADTVTKAAYVYIKPSVSYFSYQPDCSNKLEYTFKDSSLAAQSWAWNFGDGTTYNGPAPPLHVFPGEGLYTVSLTTTNGGCTHTLSRPVKVGRTKIDFFAADREACKPATMQLKTTGDAGSVRNLAWTFSRPGGPAVQSISGKDGTNTTFNTAGYYDVTMIAIDTFGCPTDTVTKLAYLRVNGPVAGFVSNDSLSCTGNTVTFQDVSKTDSLNAIVKWEWAYGAGGPDEEYAAPPFTHVYNATGSFSVRLKVTDAAGCSDVASRPAYIKTSVIKASWNAPAQTCPGAGVFFQNNTAAPVFTSLWDFGDGSTATQKSLSHSYADTGFYTVKLKVTNSSGCADSLTKTAHVYVGLPKADFDANAFLTYCTPHEAHFFNTSYYSSSVAWDLVQGTSQVANPVAYYTAKGTYNIKLTATSPGGCRDTITKQLVVKTPQDGVISYISQRGCSPVTVVLEAFEEIQNGRFIWDFGNGVVADTTVNRITYQYDGFGAFVPSVILFDPSGCVLTLSGKDSIEAVGVQIKFGLNKDLFCDVGRLQIMDSTTSNEAISYQWSFGDGATSASANPAHTYGSAGQYAVQLIATTASGCSDTSAAFPVKVLESPIIGIAGDSAFCVLERRSYTGTLQNPNSDSLRWQWVLPDGRLATGQNPATQLFAQAGNFFIQAIATNSDGCADTAVQAIRVHPLPRITVPQQPLTVTSGRPVLLPVVYSSGIDRYLWSPAAGLSCAGCPQPEASPQLSTRYTITVTDSNGCRTAAEVQVNVACAGANVFAPNTFSPNGDGRNDVFYLRGNGLGRVRTLRIFNRWGEVVFEKREVAVNDAAQGWDGRYKGRSPLGGVYVYQAEVYCSNGELLQFEGNVALIQ